MNFVQILDWHLKTWCLCLSIEMTDFVEGFCWRWTGEGRANCICTFAQCESRISRLNFTGVGMKVKGERSTAVAGTQPRILMRSGCP